jgi:hypothetical protein
MVKVQARLTLELPNSGLAKLKPWKCRNSIDGFITSSRNVVIFFFPSGRLLCRTRLSLNLNSLSARGEQALGVGLS